MHAFIACQDPSPPNGYCLSPGYVRELLKERKRRKERTKKSSCKNVALQEKCIYRVYHVGS